MSKEKTPRQRIYYKHIDGQHCLSTGALCEILNVTKETLSVWADNGAPKVARGFWPIKDLLKWRGVVSTSGVRTAEEAEAAKIKLSLQEQKLQMENQLKQAQVEAINFKNDLANGKYLLKNDVVSELSKLILVLKKSLLGLKNKIGIEASAFIDDEKVKILMIAVDDVITNWLQTMSNKGFVDDGK